MGRYYVEPAWVDEGTHVWLRWNRETGTALRCTVVVAAGNHARIQNEKYGVDRWVRVSDLLVPPESINAYGNQTVFEEIKKALASKVEPST